MQIIIPIEEFIALFHDDLHERVLPEGKYIERTSVECSDGSAWRAITGDIRLVLYCDRAKDA